MYRFFKKDGEVIEITDKHKWSFETLYVTCECTSADHVFRFSYSLDDTGKYIEDDLYLECVLSYDGFWGRLKTAFLYLINAKDIQRWNSIMITPNDAEHIKRLCELYLRSNDEIKKLLN